MIILFIYIFYLSGKLAKPRQLHNSHWGMMCPAETPEGQVIFEKLASLLIGKYGSNAYSYGN